MLIDTHAHLNFEAFKDDFEDVIRRAQDEGVEKIINVGANLDSSQKALEIAQKFENCFASVGIHPHHAEDNNLENSAKVLEELAKNPKVVAIGECGLDYYHYQNGGIADPQKQKSLFKTHLELAQKLNLPVILHCREAQNDILKITRPYTLNPNPYPIRGVFHCFSGDSKFLGAILKMGFYAGFDGNITYKPRRSPQFSSGTSKTSTASKNAQNLRDRVRETPINRLLLETDCPYLPPEPFRGLRNEPKNVKIILRAVSEIKGLPFKFIEDQTTKNAQEIFSLS